MSESLTLIQKLAKIRAMSDVVMKDRRGYNYNYADITAILANITAGMKKYGVSLIPQIVPGSTKVVQTVSVNTAYDKTGKQVDKTTTEMLVTADMVFKWIDNDNPQDCIEVPWTLTGSQGDPSQALGSGLTYCTRYFLCNYFQIAQADSDVDAYRSKQKAAEDFENRSIAEELVAKFDEIVKRCLAENPDKNEEIKKFISGYVKGANYFAIKDPATISKLLNDFRSTYIGEGE